MVRNRNKLRFWSWRPLAVANYNQFLTSYHMDSLSLFHSRLGGVWVTAPINPLQEFAEVSRICVKFSFWPDVCPASPGHELNTVALGALSSRLCRCSADRWRSPDVRFDRDMLPTTEK